jgi:hypothetical protein
MSHPADKPIYFIPPNHPFHEQWKYFIEQFGNPAIDTITFPIDPELVDPPQGAAIHQLFFALQHHPKLIEKALFAFQFQFRQIADSELYYQELDWKMEPKYYRWFFSLQSQAFILFFIRDPDARAYFLTGDYLADNKVTVHGGEPGKRVAVRFTMEQLQDIAQRFYNCARMFKLYCHGTGFDPDPYIESLINEFNFEEANMLQVIQEAYRKDIEEEVRFQIFPINPSGG